MSHRSYVLTLAVILAGCIPSGFAFPAPADNTTYYFPQVATGRSGSVYYTTEFLFNNAQNTETTLTLSFFSDGGAPWTVDLRSNDRGDAPGLTTSATITLQPWETANYYTAGQGAEASGWAVVKSSQPLVTSSGFTRYLQGSPPQLLWQAGVLPAPSATQFSCEANVSTLRDIFEGVAADTGFAIANPSVAEARITANLIPRWGGPPAVQTITVPAGGHKAQFLSELFIGYYFGDTFHGTIRFSSNVNVAMVALRRSYGGGNDIYSSVLLQPEEVVSRNMVYDREDNSSINLAQPVTTPVEIAGTLNNHDDTSDNDYYAVFVQASRTLTAYLLTDMIGSPIDNGMILYGPDLNQIKTSGNTFPTMKDGFISHTATYTGTYYIRVGGLNGVASRGQFYRLFLKVSR